MTLSRSLDERFFEKVHMTSECWEWTTAQGTKHYPSIRDESGRQWNVHRLAYELLVGPTMPGFEVHHLCHNKRCVRPEHLQLLSRSEHGKLADGGAHFRRRTHCPYGHVLDGRTKRGFRYCKTCKREDSYSDLPRSERSRDA